MEEALHKVMLLRHFAELNACTAYDARRNHDPELPALAGEACTIERSVWLYQTVVTPENRVINYGIKCAILDQSW